MEYLIEPISSPEVSSKVTDIKMTGVESLMSHPGAFHFEQQANNYFNQSPPTTPTPHDHAGIDTMAIIPCSPDPGIEPVNVSETEATMQEGQRNNKNRAILVSNLPHKVPLHAFLHDIRNAGKIYWLDLNGDYGTATMVFWDHEGASKFLQQYACGTFQRDSEVCHHCCKPLHMCWTSPPASLPLPRPHDDDCTDDKCSRVLRVSTPVNVVIRKRLRTYLGDHFGRANVEISKSELEVDEDGNHVKILTCYFGCFKGQAEEAYRLLRTEFRWSAHMKVEWGEDPCA